MVHGKHTHLDGVELTNKRGREPLARVVILILNHSNSHPTKACVQVCEKHGSVRATQQVPVLCWCRTDGEL